jgi:hypothetical protein
MEGAGVGAVERGDPDVFDDEHRRSGVGADLGVEGAFGPGGDEPLVMSVPVK